MIEKTCLHPGCKGEAFYGFGLGRQPMLWACAAHRHLLNQVRSTAPALAPKPAALTPEPGRLL